jgi:hypothetical protein
LRESLHRARRILIRPRDALTESIVERGNFWSQLPYVATLVSGGALMRFLSAGVVGVYQEPQRIFGVEVGGGWVRTPLPSLFEALFIGVAMIAAWWLLALMLNLLAPEFDARRDRRGAIKTATAVMTPIAAADALGLLNSLPHVAVIHTFALIAGAGYGGLIGSWALPLLMGTPEAKSASHVVAALGVTVLAVGGLGIFAYHLLTGLLLGGALQ